MVKFDKYVKYVQNTATLMVIFFKICKKTAAFAQKIKKLCSNHTIMTKIRQRMLIVFKILTLMVNFYPKMSEIFFSNVLKITPPYQRKFYKTVNCIQNYTTLMMKFCRKMSNMRTIYSKSQHDHDEICRKLSNIR